MSTHSRGLIAVLAILVLGCSSSTPTSSPSGGPTAAAPSQAGTSGGGGATAGPGKTPKPGKSPRASSAPSTDSPATSEPIATPAPTATAQPPATSTPITFSSDLVGSDGRFTILLLGSDARQGLIGERTDTMMVVTIDPATGDLAMVSLPRDTQEFPMAPGRTYGPKINGLYETYLSGGATPDRAYKKVKEALAYGFGIEIDHWAVVNFVGFRHLIDHIGGIDVTLKEPFVDPTSHISRKGLVLHAGKNHLDGKHALAYARSRHTSNDYERSRRQQQVIATVVEKVRAMGSDAIVPLAQFVLGHVHTDISLSDAPSLLALAQLAELGHRKSTVLGPSKFAGPGPEIYSIVMKMDVVRAFFDHLMGGG